jgi:hypothetical protein
MSEVVAIEISDLHFLCTIRTNGANFGALAALQTQGEPSRVADSIPIYDPLAAR